jgi:hypothetical protein
VRAIYERHAIEEEQFLRHTGRIIEPQENPTTKSGTDWVESPWRQGRQVATSRCDVPVPHNRGTERRLPLV